MTSVIETLAKNPEFRFNFADIAMFKRFWEGTADDNIKAKTI
jgi:hypothetical protein